MSGFFKDVMLVGAVSNNLGKTVNNLCGYDYLGELSNKSRNFLADNAIRQVENLHGKKIGDDFMPLEDLMICGFLLLAKEISQTKALEHTIILMGLMKFVLVAQDHNAKISPKLLAEVQEYAEKFSSFGILNNPQIRNKGVDKPLNNNMDISREISKYAANFSLNKDIKKL